jgi:hypothetical protein
MNRNPLSENNNWWAKNKKTHGFRRQPKKPKAQRRNRNEIPAANPSIAPIFRKQHKSIAVRRPWAFPQQILARSCTYPPAANRTPSAAERRGGRVLSSRHDPPARACRSRRPPPRSSGFVANAATHRTRGFPITSAKPSPPSTTCASELRIIRATVPPLVLCAVC